VAGADGLQEYPPRGITQPGTSYVGYRLEEYIEGHGQYVIDGSSIYNAGGDDRRTWALFDKGSKLFHGASYFTTGTPAAIDEATTTTNNDENINFNTKLSSGTTIFADWAQIELPHKILLKRNIVRNYSQLSRSAAKGYIVASNDGLTFDVLNTIGDFGYTTTHQDKVFETTTNTYYRIFRILFTHKVGGDANSAMNMGEWRLFGTPAPSALEDGHLTLGKTLTLPRVSGHAAGAETPRAESLVVHYDTTVDSAVSGNMVVDISGEGANGTLHSGAAYSSTDRALTFDGTDDYVSGTVSGFTGPLTTLSAWVYVNSIDTSRINMIASLGTYTSTNLIWLGIDDSQQFYSSIIGNSGTIYAGQAVTNQWVHLLVVITSNTFELYKNGTLLDSASYTAFTPGSSPVLYLGTRANSSGGPESTRYLDCSISNFKLWNVALTAEEVAMEYALGRTGKSINLTDTSLCLGGTVPRAQLDVRGGARFDGYTRIGKYDFEGGSAEVSKLMLDARGPTRHMGILLPSTLGNNYTYPSIDSDHDTNPPPWEIRSVGGVVANRYNPNAGDGLLRLRAGYYLKPSWIDIAAYNQGGTSQTIIFGTDGTKRMYIDNSGVGIGVSPPTRKLDVNGIARMRSNLSWSNQNAWDTNITLQAPNQVYYQARCRGWNTYSSRKLKENFEPVLDSLDKVKKLNGVYYTWKNGEGDNVPPPEDYDTTEQVKQQKHIGFIADEVAPILPWVCTFDENGEANGLDYGAITPVLVNAIKELDLKIGKSEASSDDRLKDNEKYITNATATLMKLKPQVYDKKESLSSNVYQHESGLIAQDIWYDAPELRFAVKPGLLSDIPVDAPARSDDPRVDPDYSKWGPNPASVDYNYLIPYAIKSIQEIVTELPREKTQVQGITPANVDDYRGLLVSADTNELKSGVPKLSVTQKSYDKKCFGVVSYSNTYTTDNQLLVDTKSCSRMWVINFENIESGDYLTSSNVAGYAMKQNDDLLHNYTVAKSCMDCDFTPVQKIIRRVKQQLQNVTHYVKTQLYEITKEQYDSLNDMYRTSREHSFYTKSDYTKVTGKGGYDKFEYSKPKGDDDLILISVDEWNSLESNVQDEYSPYYSNLCTTQVSLEDYTTLDESERAKCVLTTKTVYSYKVRTESKDPLPGYEPEIRQEYVDVLDSNGQIQWEDTEQTENSYQLRYLDAHGHVTDKTNAAHVAALITVYMN
jgi:hypothetical protein